ncbi:hypothetical protein DERF_007664 [Dermatophagoides farinae]|uniref:Uncharacterized protein n=1 Tax=Dermatophagoides farinae TaxID=6954 RepID=A0A922I2Q8_DERFA|nr:hypothetical protein DERF_007664 [Dermatophagoides farinae]
MNLGIDFIEGKKISANTFIMIAGEKEQSVHSSVPFPINIRISREFVYHEHSLFQPRFTNYQLILKCTQIHLRDKL